MISVGSLVAAGIGPTQARAFVDHFAKTCDLFDISTLERQAAFFAQCAHESGRFVHLEEGLYYRDPARIMKVFPRSVPSLALAKTLAGNPVEFANTVYANKNGNGPYISGDGYRFHGRGLIHLTGRANYTAAALELHEPYIEHPEYVADVADACLTAGWFWQRNRCNGLADAGDFAGITRAVNGPGMVGAADRLELYQRALVAFR